MRTLMIVGCLTLLCGATQALETSLILRPPTAATDRVVVIEPGLGIMSLYEANTQTLRQRGRPVNFLADLEYLQKFPVVDREGWNLLRTGLRTEPTNAQMMQLYGAMGPGQGDSPSFRQQVENTEERFWQSETPPTYDGVVRGAMLNNGVLLVIPSTYTMLLYEIRNDVIQLVSARNYRLDLYIPQVFQSAPTPQQILELLPEDVQAERREALEEQMAALVEELGDDAEAIIPMQESEPWVAATQDAGQQFVVVDPANKRLLSYRFRAGQNAYLELLSVRNLEIDLMIPTTWNSTPPVAGVVDAYNALLADARRGQISADYLVSLSNEVQVNSDQVSDFHAVLDPAGMLILNFTDQRQLLTYRTFGSSGGVELIGARDYSMEAGIGVHAKLLQQLDQGRGLLDDIENAVRNDNLDRAFVLARIALEWNPWLYRPLEENRRVVRALGGDERWQPLIEQAAAEKERREEQIRRIQEQAEARERAREERRQGGG